MRYKEQYNQGSFKERGGRAGIYNLFAPMAAIVLILVLAACVAAYDPFEDIRNATDPLFAVRPNADINDISLLQVKVKMGKFHNFCEICTSMLQTKMRGEADLCANLKDDYYVTCVENLESLLRADKALVYWLKNGCIHMDAAGPEVIRPCPAMAVCSWVPNLFAQPPFVSQDGVETLCPRDPKFLPSIPQEYKDLLQAK